MEVSGMSEAQRNEDPLDRRVSRALLKRDREWRDYPVGTKAHAYNGGAWLKTVRGWQWNGHTRSPGSTFPTPGADAIGACVELPCPLCSGSGAVSPSQRCICTY